MHMAATCGEHQLWKYENKRVRDRRRGSVLCHLINEPKRTLEASAVLLCSYLLLILTFFAYQVESDRAVLGINSHDMSFVRAVRVCIIQSF